MELLRKCRAGMVSEIYFATEKYVDVFYLVKIFVRH